MSFSFELEGTSGAARAGRIRTAHGSALTPLFMPVGTRGTVKGILPRDLAALGASFVLGNTYHLMLRPGCEVLEAAGGLHEFVRWDRPMLTDSGGFQVFSLAAKAKVDPDGVVFSSTYDGARLRLGPVESMAAQRSIGADIVMAFDFCPSLPAATPELERAVELTTRWARVSRDQPLHAHQSLFGIVQGGDDPELRARSAAEIQELGFAGYAIGGLSVGESQDTFERVCRATAALLPADRPRYLMGVGTPRDLVTSIDAGVDMFDCVMPTRNGRNAQAFTRSGILRLRRAENSRDNRPIEEGCPCPTCERGFSRAYLRHLFGVDEMLGPILTSLHNLSFYLRLMARCREAILAGGDAFAALRDEVLAAYPPRTDSPSPWNPPQGKKQRSG